MSSLMKNAGAIFPTLGLSDPEYLGAAYRTRPPGGGTAVFHYDAGGVLNLSLSSAFQTISLHLFTSAS